CVEHVILTTSPSPGGLLNVTQPRRMYLTSVEITPRRTAQSPNWLSNGVVSDWVSFQALSVQTMLVSMPVRDSDLMRGDAVTHHLQGVHEVGVLADRLDLLPVGFRGGVEACQVHVRCGVGASDLHTSTIDGFRHRL